MIESQCQRLYFPSRSQRNSFLRNVILYRFAILPNKPMFLLFCGLTVFTDFESFLGLMVLALISFIFYASINISMLLAGLPHNVYRRTCAILYLAQWLYNFFQVSFRLYTESGHLHLKEFGRQIRIDLSCQSIPKSDTFIFPYNLVLK